MPAIRRSRRNSAAINSPHSSRATGERSRSSRSRLSMTSTRASSMLWLTGSYRQKFCWLNGKGSGLETSVRSLTGVKSWVIIVVKSLSSEITLRSLWALFLILFELRHARFLDALAHGLVPAEILPVEWERERTGNLSQVVNGGQVRSLSHS